MYVGGTYYATLAERKQNGTADEAAGGASASDKNGLCGSPRRGILLLAEQGGGGGASASNKACDKIGLRGSLRGVCVRF